MRLHKIGFAAKSAGVGVDTVRYYEREGLLIHGLAIGVTLGLAP